MCLLLSLVYFSMLKTGVWGKELTKRIDKELEEVGNSTDEEFHAYYKKKDEMLFSLIEGNSQLLFTRSLLLSSI